MFVKTFYFNPYRECTYIIYNERAHECIIIDCGAFDERERQRLATFIRDNELTPVAHLITHTHPDHTCGADFITETYGIRPTIFPTEGQLSIGCADSSSTSGTTSSASGTTSSASGASSSSFAAITVLRTPGHKEDCVCYYIESEGIIFTGDTLFQESIGRTDLPGGDMSALMTSLKRLSTLPHETTVYPGHGYSTTIAHELEYNPYM